VQAPAPDWLSRDVIACLEEKCGTLVDAVLIAYASGGVGGELHSLGVRDMSTFGGADVYVPEGRERVVWARVVDYHGCVAREPQEPKETRPRQTREEELDLGGSYSPVELTAGAKAYASGRRTIDEVKAAARISYRRARRLRSWLEAGAIFWDGRTVKAARGYQLTRIDPDSEHPAVRLVRLYPA
jgi:hypothetical protein